MKKILINAYTALNFGDDLFIKVLCERYPNTKFFIICDHSFAYPFKQLNNITIIPRIPVVDALFKKVKIKIRINDIFYKLISHYCDAVVHIGGSIFMQNDNWEKKLDNFRKKVLMSERYYIIGSNFGPFNNETFLIEYKEIFKSVTDICFRDKYSFSLFSTLENTRYESDVVFSLNTQPIQSDEKQIVISVIDLSWRESLFQYEDDYIRKIVEISTYFINDNYTICLLGYCTREGDNKAIKKIYSQISEHLRNYVYIYNYDGNIDEVINLMNNCTGIIASRFHAMILGWKLNKVVLPLVYSEKSLNVMSDMMFNGLFQKIENINQLNVKAVIEYFEKSNIVNIKECVSSSTAQFSKLDDFLFSEVEE